MTKLMRERCVACRADAPPVTEADIAELHPQIPEWELITDDGIRKLVRTFKFPNFAEALVFTISVADMAEEVGHHPRIITEWGRVEVSWWSHKIRDLHRNDFVCAAKTDAAHIVLLATRSAGP